MGGRLRFYSEIDERLTRNRRLSVVPLAIEPVDNRVGAGSRQVTEGMSSLPMGKVLPERPRIQYGYRGTYHHGAYRATLEVSGKLPILRERPQAERVTESKCLQRKPKGMRAARKGIGGLLPGAESRSSKARVSDGALSPTQKTRCTTACCWAVETSTTGVKAVQGLTRPCADLAEFNDDDARAIASPDRAWFNTPCADLAEFNDDDARAIASPDRACAKTDFLYGPFDFW